MQPRFADEAFRDNLALVEEVKAVAGEVGAAPAQVALAWVLARGDEILTIPGTTKPANLQSNLGAANVALTADQTARLDRLADRVKGGRYPESRMANINA
jgi:aryl-alcohol dehydrogenase-like predicted oxidoreductase